MTRSVHRPAPLDQAVCALHSAVAAFLASGAQGTLPLGSFHADALRSAALRVLAVLDSDDVGCSVALAADRSQRVARAVGALEAVEFQDLRGDERLRLLEAVTFAYCELRAVSDDDVTRTLLDVTPVGPELAELVFTCDPNALTPDAQVSFCQAAQRLESATHARLSAGLVAFAGSNPRNTPYFVDGDAYELADVRASELASALTWSDIKARNALESARVMSGELDSVADAAAQGTLQPSVLTAITDGARLLTSTLDDEIDKARQALRCDTDSSDDISERLWELSSARQELMERYDAAVSAFGSTHTLAETKRKVRDTLAKLDPAGFEARRAKARELQSGVEFRGLPDAMAMITAVMPAEHATACYRAIDAVAVDARLSDPALPIGVRRSDALLALCAQRATVGEGATPSISAHVDLVMTLDAFLGLADTPAECVGAGPIPASEARAFLADAALISIRRVLVDDSKEHALDVGVARYQLNAAERDYILARDRTCRRPGCNQPAHKCETDHAVAYADGGPSRTDNLGALCVRHHQEKTHGGWIIGDSRADGSCTFVSPLGRRYEHLPEPVLPWAAAGPAVAST